MSSAVSVIIPTRDRGQLVVDAVRSALAAPNPPAEVLVVDTGSTDGSVEEVERLGQGIRVLRGDFRNPAKARNTGAAEAKGEYLGFLDSDDLLAAGKTSCLADVLASQPRAALVHGTTDVIGADGRPLPDKTAAQAKGFAFAQRIGTSYGALAGFCAMFTSATLIRKEAFDSVGGYDEALDAYEDWDLYLRLSLDWRLVYADCPAAVYRIWSGNVGWRRTAEWTIRVAEKHLAALPPLPPGEWERARYGFFRRLALSHHVLVNRRAAVRAAFAAARIAPVQALHDSDVRRPLLHSFLPPRVLFRRRPAT